MKNVQTYLGIPSQIVFGLQGNRTQTQGNNVVPATDIAQHVSNRAPQSLQKPRIVILGSGWGAMSFIKGMSKKDRCIPYHTK